MIQKPITENIRSYKSRLQELALSIQQAEQIQAGKRYTRKLHRKFILLRSFITIASPAVDIIRQYHDHPLDIISRYWRSLDGYTMIIHNSFPTLADFFEWYCSSTVIAEECRQNCFSHQDQFSAAAWSPVH